MFRNIKATLSVLCRISLKCLTNILTICWPRYTRQGPFFSKCMGRSLWCSLIIVSSLNFKTNGLCSFFFICCAVWIIDVEWRKLTHDWHFKCWSIYMRSVYKTEGLMRHIFHVFIQERCLVHTCTVHTTQSNIGDIILIYGQQFSR